MKLTSFQTSSNVWTEKELLVNSLSSNPYLKSGKDLLSFIDGLLVWDYVTLSYNNKSGETSHVYSMTQHYDFEDLF